MKRRQVLILDDDADMCAMLARALGAVCGRVCRTFGSVGELQSAEGLSECDTAILDYRLGHGATGLDACRFLRGIGFAGRIVFFTGDADALFGRPELDDLGVLRVFAKPTDINELLTLVCD